MRTRVAVDGGKVLRSQQREGDGRVASADAPAADPQVLVVDDEESLADSIAIWLDQEWSARVAHDGPEALDKYGPNVDAVLLDRRMPAVSGDEVLREIRETDDTPVAMMTAVDPDWSILEMDFDLYLKKPVTHDDVATAVEQLLTCARYPPALRDLFATGMKLRRLHREYPPEAFRQAERYAECRAELRRLRDRAGDSVDRLDEHAADLRDFIDDVVADDA